MVLLAPRPRVNDRFEQSVDRGTLVSTRSVAKVSRFDGHTRIVAVRTRDGWHRGIRMPWTRDSVEQLRGDVREVLLSRFFRRARIPLAWVPKGEYR